jgi:hypothetical protein
LASPAPAGPLFPEESIDDRSLIRVVIAVQLFYHVGHSVGIFNI